MKIFPVEVNVIYSDTFRIRAESKEDARLCVLSAFEHDKISLDDFPSCRVELDYFNDGFLDDGKRRYDLSSDKED